MPSRLKTGDKVVCVFDDHSHGGSKPPRFKCMGWLMEIKEDSPARGGGYKIGSWLYEDETEARLDDNRSENEDWWWISKGSVVSIKKVE